ncbi:MAG TPA: nucleotidyltransferase family protein [Polyangiaceae bacterium]|nr:nucleotidyltransferase family protein [Polyangiaceae bacterium]
MTSLDLRAVSAALRKTTELLATELARPGPAAPDWTPFEWQIAQAAATLHGVSALLARSLRWQGPPGWQRFLTEQSAHTATRHNRLQRALALISDRARAEGIPVLPLKGCALYAAGLYEDGTRPMADLDLLVAPADGKRAHQMLEALGFQEAYLTWKHSVFLPRDFSPVNGFGEHAENPTKIELHETICEELPRRRVELSNALFPLRAQPGSNSYRSTGALMAHLLLHTAGAMVPRSARLLHLLDIARLARRMSEENWRELFELDAWWAYPPLKLAARYFDGIPEAVLARAATSCPRLLGKVSARSALSDLSLSSLWIEAFPGIEWARTMGEALGLVVSRVRPGAEIIRLRQILRDEPYHSDSTWARKSQARRIVSWVTSRQPRPVTLHAVRSALALAQ